MSPDMWIALGAFLILAAAAWILHLAGYVPQARELLARRQPATGRHAAKPGRSHAKDAPQPAAPQDEADPFADPDAGTDPDKAADEYVAELRGSEELILVPAPRLTAPLEPLPPSPLDRRERTVIPADGLPAWSPPASRGTLESLRDALLAKTWPAPDPAEAAAPEPEPGPEPEPDWLTTSAINAFAPVLELGDVGEYVDRVFAPAEKAVSAVVAEHFGSEEKGDFAGMSLAGLRDWDLSRPVTQMLPGQHATGTEAAS